MLHLYLALISCSSLSQLRALNRELFMTRFSLETAFTESKITDLRAVLYVVLLVTVELLSAIAAADHVSNTRPHNYAGLCIHQQEQYCSRTTSTSLASPHYGAP
ncbi:hypothetical protein ACQKWADRAFT_280183 [Trichoderma austrokoningii]